MREVAVGKRKPEGPLEGNGMPVSWFEADGVDLARFPRLRPRPVSLELSD
jgi:hypothetical protein